MIASLTTPIARFFSWWFGELAACVPAGLRGSLAGRRNQIAVDYRGQEIELRHHGRSDWRSLGVIAVDRDAPAAGRAAALSVLRGVRRGAEIVLRLPAAQVLRRRVELPLAAAENLREVLGFEMDRLTPFKSADAAYDYRIVASDRETQRLTVDLTAAPLALVEEAVRVATALGLAPDRVGVANGLDSEAGRLDLMSAPGDSGGRGWLRLNLALAALLCLLLAAVALWPLYREQGTLAALEERLQDSRAAATATE